MPNIIDSPAFSNLWTQQDVNLYNKLPYYLAKTQIKFFKKWQTFSKLLPKQKWTPNMSSIMKGVHKEFSPVLRSTFFPNPLTQISKKDVIEVRETTEQAQLYKHRFESNLLPFLPSFQDFLTDVVDFYNEDLVQKIQVAYDLFLRTYLFHASPDVWVCGKAQELTPTAYITGSGMQQAKTTAGLQALVAQCNKPFDLKNLNKLGTVMSVDRAVPFYEGSEGQEMNEGLKGKYCAVIDSECWDNFSYDPYLLANRPLDMNIVTDRFKGNLWGKWTTMLERFPIRIAADGTIPAPETIQENADAYNYGETDINPAYKNAPFVVYWAFGADGYKSLEAGPPPEPFSSGEMGMKQFRAMDWNGKVQITKDVMVPGLDAGGNPITDTNKYGEYIQFISQLVMGVIATRRRNVVPVIALRQRVGASI